MSMIAKTPSSLMPTLSELKQWGVISNVTPSLKKVTASMPCKITGTIRDILEKPPIARQFVPTEQEAITLSCERVDPIGDDAHSPVEGLIHRYPDRVLLTPLYDCAVHCRFCFRRNKVGKNQKILSPENMKKAFAYIQDHKEIWEVILSGGDPLLLSDRRLKEIIGQLEKIKHVHIIRLHSRIPVVKPERITPNLVKILCCKKPIYLLIHCNHPDELTVKAQKACAPLTKAGIPLLSQSVLLRGVNDDSQTLQKLMRSFVENKIKPHYLHHLDLAQGTSHFHVPIEKGQELLDSLRGNLSGLCQPTYILDIPCGFGKVPIGPSYLQRNKNETYRLRDFRGGSHIYKDNHHYTARN